MACPKSLERQIDDVIETDIRFWQESKQREAEQMWLQMEKEIDEQEDRANNYD
jgi:hypothetical protein